MSKRLISLLIKFKKEVIFGGTLLALVAGWFSVQLYCNLRPDIEELLPETARSVIDLNHLSERLESFDNMVVLVFSKETEKSKRFVNDLAKRLNEVPHDIVARVEYRIGHEVEFFKQRQALYLDVPDLKGLSTYLRDRILYEKTIRNPIRLFPLDEIHEPEYDFDALQNNADASAISSYTRFSDGYYATADNTVRAVVVYMPGKGLDHAHRMKDAIEKVVTDLNPTSYGADIKVRYTGNVANLIEESSALVADLEFSTFVVIIAVMLAMIVFYRSFWATSALVLSLFMGTLWTFGFAYFAIGYLNANTAFLASIVIGNGINFGIIFLARYLEERNQMDAESAVAVAMKKTAPATAIAALAAGLSYASLMLTSFRGFNQFGLIGLAGMVLCWISAYTLLPAFLMLFDSRIIRNFKGGLGTPVIMGAIARGVGRFPRALCSLALVAAFLSVATFRNWGPHLIETDFSKLRDKRSMAEGSGGLYHYIDEIFGHSSSPLVILTQGREEAGRIADRLRAAKMAAQPTFITTVQTLADFVPLDQEKKITVLREIKKMLSPQILKFMEPETRTIASEMMSPSAFRQFTEADLPPLVLARFREKSGTVGQVVLVDKLIEEGKDDSRSLAQFMTTVRGAAEAESKGAPVAGELAVTYDMFEAITHDGPKVTLVALGIVVLLVIAIFRDVKTASLALFALGIGVLWFAGLVLGFGLKINFLNFIALPITFGIGVDYGVNIFQRYRETGKANILEVIRSTGGAVVLCSLTTVIGYSSLLLAGNRAFVSFGLLAVLGEITCVLAAVVALPALLSLTKAKEQAPEKQQTAMPAASLIALLIGATALLSSTAIGEQPAPASLPTKPAVFHPLEETLTEGKQSYYSPRMASLLKSWPPPGIPELTPEGNPIWMQAVRTKEQSSYIGVQKRIYIAAPLRRVRAIIDDFAHYPDLYPEVNSVKMTVQDGNKMEVAWERKAPAFFLPNVRYETIYLSDDRSPNRMIYRYQLKKGNSVNFSDGLIVLEKRGESVTVLTAFDFFDMDWGLLRAVAESSVWKRVLDGSYVADAALKAMAEHPEWNASQIETESKRLQEAYPLSEIVYVDSVFPLEAIQSNSK